MSEEVRVKFLALENVMGLEAATVRFDAREPGKGQLITLVGGNAVGKTSFLKGVGALFAGGHDPSIIRDGADKAVIRMGTTDGVEYIRTVTHNGYYLKGVASDGLKFDPPESAMKRMASGFGFDPIAFDQAAFSRDGKKKQLDFFLKYLPMTFTAAEISKAMNGAAKIVTAPTGDQDITGVGKLLKELTEKRAAISASRDEKANSVETFRKSLVEGDSEDKPKDWGAEVARLTKERNDLEKSELADVEHINGLLKTALNLNGEVIQKEEGLLSGHYQRLLGIARAGNSFDGLDENFIRDKFDEIRDLYIQRKNYNVEADEAIAKIKAENVVTRERIAGELATAQAGNDAQQRSAGVRESMATLQKEAVALSEKWDTVAAAVKAIEALKQSKLAELPVDGVEIVDGELYLDSLPWKSVNQARRWLKSIEIGCQALGDARLLICDEAEHLEKTNWEAFEEAVISFGLTVIAARVSSPEEIKKHGRKLRSEPAEALVMA